MNISALILAAGSGSRIGKPKLILEYGGKSFLKIIAEKIGNTGIKNIVCVISSDKYDWAKENVPGIEYIINPNPENGMISSVYYGVKELNICDAVLIIPVDHPFVLDETYKLIIGVVQENKGCVIKPKYKDKSGHPVIIPNELFETILKNDFSVGLDKIIAQSGCKQKYIDVEDIGVVNNINTKNDFNIE
ncbi:MAG: nucleotidyltransferase family protein [Ignavibacteriae bacterium]|nr:nucleotidyltransferase family protein [Ignavibacteriota bacterium]